MYTFDIWIFLHNWRHWITHYLFVFNIAQMTMHWGIFFMLRTVYVSSKNTVNPCLHKYRNGFSKKNYSACCNIRPLMVGIPSNNIYRLLQFNLFVILESWCWWDAQSNVTVCSQEPRCEILLIEKRDKIASFHMSFLPKH